MKGKGYLPDNPIEIGGCDVCGKFCGNPRHVGASECRQWGHSFTYEKQPDVCVLCLWDRSRPRDERGRFV